MPEIRTDRIYAERFDNQLRAGDRIPGTKLTLTKLAYIKKTSRGATNYYWEALCDCGNTIVLPRSVFRATDIEHNKKKCPACLVCRAVKRRKRLESRYTWCAPGKQIGVYKVIKRNFKKGIIVLKCKNGHYVRRKITPELRAKFMQGFNFDRCQQCAAHVECHNIRALANVGEGRYNTPRNQEIYQMHMRGSSQAAIGRFFGVTRERIRQILKQEERRKNDSLQAS